MQTRDIYVPLTCLGHSEDSSDISQEMETDAHEMARVSNITTKHGEKICVTVKCFNNRGLFGVAFSHPVYVVLEPPRTSEGYIKTYPKASTHYTPQKSTQAGADSLEYSHHNLAIDDMDFTSFYEMSVDGGVWLSMGNLSHILFTPPNSMSNREQHEIAVRAVNGEGSCSNPLFSTIAVDDNVPQLTGNIWLCSNFKSQPVVRLGGFKSQTCPQDSWQLLVSA